MKKFIVLIAMLCTSFLLYSEVSFEFKYNCLITVATGDDATEGAAIEWWFVMGDFGLIVRLFSNGDSTVKTINKNIESKYSFSNFHFPSQQELKAIMQEANFPNDIVRTVLFLEDEIECEFFQK